MPETVLQASVPAPLTTLTEDEILFRDNIRQFADEKIRPLVKEMDEKAIFDKDLIHDFFQLGLMGIEIPEQYGGGGAKVFRSDPRRRRIVARGRFLRSHRRRAEHAGQQRPAALGQRKSRRNAFCRKMAADTVGAYALSEAGSGSDAFALQTRATLKGSDYILNGRKLWITNAKEAGCLCSSPPSIPPPDTKASPHF